MRRLTPYIFFLLAVFAFAMISQQPDTGWQTEEVDPVQAVLIVAGVLIGAHVLRRLAEMVYDRWKDRQK